MGAIHLEQVSKEMSTSVRERNKYLVKAPGEHSGKKEGIPVQDKVRNLKSRLRRSSLILTCEPHLK
jgi:hypothetical protein